jgi:hypothetical protein
MEIDDAESCKDRRARKEELAMELLFDSTPNYNDLEEMVAELHTGKVIPICNLSDSALHLDLMSPYICMRCGKVTPVSRVEALDDPEVSKDGGLLELFDLGCPDYGDCQCTAEEREAFGRERLGLDPLGLAGGGG